MDRIEVEVLVDGTLKITTGRISGVNHTNADGLLKAVAQAAGGSVSTKRRININQAIHEDHDHDHEHGPHTHQH